MVLINCLDVCLKYGSNIVVKNFSYSFNTGNFICIVGPNGCGKSTLLKGILGLKFLSGGRVDFVNLERKEIGFLPQKFNFKSDFPASVFEVVLSGFCADVGFLGFYSKKNKEKVLEILDYLDLTNLKFHAFKDLSKGQQQRVLFARAICYSRKILFLDEPCANLDPISTSKIYATVKMLNEKYNVAVVMVTHDLYQLFNFSNLKIIHMNKEPVFIGTADDYFKSSVGRNFSGGLESC